MTGPEEIPTADELLAHREILREQGINITVEELCARAPTPVKEEVARRLAAVIAAERAFESTCLSGDGPAAPSFVPVGRAGRYIAPTIQAEGGMGVLCIAHDVELGRPVAYKVMKPGLAHNPDARNSFFNEAEITARLAHPGIVPIFGRVTDDSGVPAYACEYITGHTLQTMTERLHALPPTDRPARARARADLLSSFIATCHIIAYAHSRNVVHGDVKPLNIMVDEFGSTRLVDWGVAQVLDAESMHGSAPRRGTPWFISSPDRPATFASDIYALGLTLAYILSEPDHARRAELRPAPDTSPALWAVAQKAIRTDRAERYSSAEQFARDVQDVLDDRSVRAYKDPALTRLRRWASRHRPAVASAVALLLMAAIAGPIAGARERQLRQRADSQRLRVLQVTREMLDQADQVGRFQATLPGSRALLGRAVQLMEQMAHDGEADAADLGQTAGYYYRAGRIYQNLNQLDEAVRCYQRSNVLAERKLALAPHDAKTRDELAAGLRDWGVTRLTQGHADEAARAWAKALEIIEPVAAAAPDYRWTLARVLYALGNLAMLSGNQTKAQESFAKAQLLAERLVREAPEDPRYIRALADVRSNQGMSLQMEARSEGRANNVPAKLAVAAERHREALALRRSLVRLEPGKPENVADVAASLNHLGNVSQLSGKPHFSEAEAFYREARTMLEALVLAFPGVPGNHLKVAEVYANLNALLVKQSRFDEAQTLARAAVDLFTRLASEYPGTPDFHYDLAVALARLADTLRLRGDPSEVAARRYDSSVAFARASALTREPGRREEWAKSAIAQLNVLNAAGFFRSPAQASALRQEAALSQLRDRPDFPKLPTP